MHLPATSLPGALQLYADPAGQAIANQVFARRADFVRYPGPLLVTGGGLVLSSPGNGIAIKEGGAAARSGVATLVAGAVTVNTTSVTANSRVFLTGQNSSGTAGELTISSRAAGTSFTITSSSAADTRAVAWLLIEPAA